MNQRSPRLSVQKFKIYFTHNRWSCAAGGGQAAGGGAQRGGAPQNGRGRRGARQGGYRKAGSYG